VFPSQIEAVLAQEKRLAPHYVLELRRPDRLDELDVVVETRANAGGQLPATELTELERHAEHLIKVYVGVTTRVRVVEPGTIERSQGKAKRVVDLRAKK
jgi:phenylacetate-CoA ligase